MNETLNLCLLEYDISWENPEANFEFLRSEFEQIQSDIVLLPEMFSTGFTMKPEKFAEPEQGKSFQFLKEIATKYQFAISGSISTQKENVYVNRLYWVNPDGTFRFYDKKHLFSYGNEQKHYTAGNQKILIDYLGWRICPLVCYDLRFPVWCRNDLDYDLLFFVANWPAKRIQAWERLLQARAIENMVYVAGVNRTGNDGNGILHNGKSQVFNELGDSLAGISQTQHATVYQLNKATLNNSRKHFGFLNDRDNFLLTD